MIKKVKLLIAVMAIIAVSSSVVSGTALTNGSEYSTNWVGCGAGRI